MKMKPGMQFENYYWMEGPLSDDQGCRVTVLHAGQVQQCSHCLRRAPFCPGGGNGKACETMKTPRGKLGDYMKYLKERYNYTSLKMQYMVEQFPALGDSNRGGFGDIEEIDEPEDIETTKDPNNKDQLVSDVLKEQLTQAKAQLKIEQNKTAKAAKKLEHVEKVASQRIIESMSGEHFEDDSNHLTMLLATVIRHDDFEYDVKKDQVEPKQSSEFLKNIKDSCADIPDKEANLTLVENKVLEKMKRTVRRERRLSIGGSMCSDNSQVGSRSVSKTRQRSEGEEVDGESASKIRKSRIPNPKSS